MTHHRPFRFGASCAAASSPDEWRETARKVEALGYSTLVLGDHPAFGGLAPLSALQAAAAVTTTLRLGTLVLANDFHHPVMLAQEIASLDQFSGGRVELGLGTGWFRADYASVGIPFDPPGVRLSRLEEALPLIKKLFQEETVSHAGTFYQVQNARVDPKPIQHPHPPLLIGGGGRRILSLAAREADIVSLDPIATPTGTKDMATITAEAMAQQVGWVREAAGARFESLELQLLASKVVVTEDRRRGAEEVVAFLAGAPPMMFSNAARGVAEILASPRFLIGTVEQIIEDLLAWRERYHLSYLTVMDFPGMPSNIEALSPVVAQLAGK